VRHAVLPQTHPKYANGARTTLIGGTGRGYCMGDAATSRLRRRSHSSSERERDYPLASRLGESASGSDEVRIDSLSKREPEIETRLIAGDNDRSSYADTRASRAALNIFTAIVKEERGRAKSCFDLASDVIPRAGRSLHSREQADA